MALVLPLTAGLAEPALAAPPLRFEYVLEPGAERCPDQEMVQNALAARLGAAPFVDEADRVLKARVERKSEGGFIGTVQLRDQSGVIGERVVESKADDCYELAKAMELAIAIAIDPLAVMAPPPPPSPEEEGPPPPRREGDEGYVPPEVVILRPIDAAPARPALTLPPPRPEDEGPPPPPNIESDDPSVLQSAPDVRGSDWQVFAHADARVHLGAAPQPTLGANLGAGVRWRFLSLGLEAAYDAPVLSAPVYDAPSQRVHLSVIRNLLQANACAHVSIVFGCGKLGGGRLSVRSDTLAAVNDEVSTFYMQAGLRGGTAFQLFPWWPVLDLIYLRVIADIDAPLWGHQYVVDDDTLVFESSWLNLSAGAGLMVAWP